MPPTWRNTVVSKQTPQKEPQGAAYGSCPPAPAQGSPESCSRCCGAACAAARRRCPAGRRCPPPPPRPPAGAWLGRQHITIRSPSERRLSRFHAAGQPPKQARHLPHRHPNCIPDTMPDPGLHHSACWKSRMAACSTHCPAIHTTSLTATHTPESHPWLPAGCPLRRERRPKAGCAAAPAAPARSGGR